MLNEIFKGMDNAAEVINENFQNVGIVESGENENGHWAKLGNGWMVCYDDSIAVNQTTNELYGQVYSSAAFEWVFPMAFISEPVVTPVARRIGGGGAWGGQTGTVSKDKVDDLRVFGTHITSRGTLQGVAIGRYK